MAARPTSRGSRSRPTSRRRRRFKTNPADPGIKESTKFNAKSSTDSDGTIVSYVFDFGDGKSKTSTDGTRQPQVQEARHLHGDGHAHRQRGLLDEPRLHRADRALQRRARSGRDARADVQRQGGRQAKVTGKSPQKQKGKKVEVDVKVKAKEKVTAAATGTVKIKGKGKKLALLKKTRR